MMTESTMGRRAQSTCVAVCLVNDVVGGQCRWQRGLPTLTSILIRPMRRSDFVRVQAWISTVRSEEQLALQHDKVAKSVFDHDRGSRVSQPHLCSRRCTQPPSPSLSGHQRCEHALCGLSAWAANIAVACMPLSPLPQATSRRQRRCLLPG